MVQEQNRGPQQEADDTSSRAQYRDESHYCSHPCNSPSFRYRSTWSNRGQFFLTSLGYTTGLSSICIFPVLCHYHGGSAFLVSVVVLYLLLGAPLLLLEVALGQLSRQSPASLFPKICPLLAGVGLSMCWSTILVSLSEVCLLSWSLLYIYKTADCKLPWSHQSNVSTGSSAAEYYVHNVLGLSPDLNSFGNIRGDILLATVITWVAVAVCLSAGIRKTGRLCYVIPPLTLVATVVLFIQGCLLWDTRVSAAVSPDWVHLTVPQTWLAASVYVYHSLNLGRGGLTTIGSFNKEHTNLIRDVALLCLVHFTWGVILWLTFVCFTLGNGLQLEPYAGPWVLFVSVAKGLAALPHGVPFALLTYSLVFITGLSTLAGNILMVISSVLAIFPKLQSQRSAVTATTCLGIFLLGIPLTSQIGLHLYWLLIHYAVSWVPVLHGLCVVLVVGLCYGYVQFVADLGYTSGIYLKEWVERHLIVLYSSLLPVLLLVLLASTLHIASHSPTRQSTYPDWGVALGWLLTALPLFVLLSSGAAFKLFNFLKKHSFRKSLMLLVKPDEMWVHNTFRTGSRVSEKTTMTSPVIISGCKEYENNNLSSYIDRNLQHGDREQDSFDL